MMIIFNNNNNNSNNRALLLLIEILFATFYIVQMESVENAENMKDVENVENAKGIFLNFLFGNCKKCRCGVPNRNARLIGGEYLRSYEFPWLVLIRAKNESIVGSLISDRYVLTTAAPLAGLTKYDVKISLGQFDRCAPDVTSINVSVEAITIHPEYSPDNRANDIALLRTNSVVLFDRNISPVCLPTPGSNYLGEVAAAASWADANSKVTCRPRKIGLPVLNREECLGTATNPHTISMDKGCIGVIGAPSMLCKEDAGVPVSYRSYAGIYEIIGVINDKNACSTLPNTSTYTKINHHLNWIIGNTRNSCFCLKY